jgi:two-component system chemotaxis response regulator CheB
MTRATTRVLIVDDSATMRATLRRILIADPAIDVVGMAPEPNAARAMIKDLNPDVVVLDIEMPGMDGLSFLEKIMRLRPMPVVMCSTLTASGAETTIEALRLGAVECIAKPVGGAVELAREAAGICAIVKAAARSRVRPVMAALPVIAEAPQGRARDVVIAIGASTGGVEALFSALAAFPVDCPPVLVVQHMPAAYTPGFAARLDKECRVNVVQAVDGAPLAGGTVYIAPGGATHMELVGGPAGHVRLTATPAVGGHRPSVDVLFRSVARLGPAGIGVVMTGMGSDGAEGLSAMRAAGARTFGQSRASCVVYGMPRAAFEAGAVEQELSLVELPRAILAACRK